jgi:hypothetical protein
MLIKYNDKRILTVIISWTIYWLGWIQKACVNLNWNANYRGICQDFWRA